MFTRSIHQTRNLASKDGIIKSFWDNFYNELEERVKSGQIKSIISSNTNQYYEEVLNVLQRNKCTHHDDEKDRLLFLKKLQMEIEGSIFKFDTESIHKSAMELFKLLTSSDGLSAKDFIKLKKCKLSVYELRLINSLGRYTLEGIIIHVLGSVFNGGGISNVLVKAPTLIKLLDSMVRYEGEIIVGKNEEKETKRNYQIGKSLLDFLIERELLIIDKDLQLPETGTITSKQKWDNKVYVYCNFDMAILPMKLNLPMVYPPLDWQESEDSLNDSVLSNYKGGYLCGVSGEFYNRFRLLSSQDYNHFSIKMHNPISMCGVLNRLQSEVFQVNTKLLSFIDKNRSKLEEEELLSKPILSIVNPQDLFNVVRYCFIHNNDVKNVTTIKRLLSDLLKWMQQSRYERIVLDIARAYAGYDFYLPAFIDFCGRIYRSGILHFHERDLSKSFIVFSSFSIDEYSKEDELELRMELASAAAFKYKKLTTNSEGKDWYLDMYKEFLNDDDKLIEFTRKASDPFQFLSKYLFNDRVTDKERINGLCRVPVTQDASASAYQIMSYLLLNKDMARRTNLLPYPDKNEIQDLYLSLRENFLAFLRDNLDTDKYSIVESRLSRQIIKKLFMPLIYGKTLIAMSSDIREEYGSLLSGKDHYNIAKLSLDFWMREYPDIANLMRLINLIGGFCSSLNTAVLYSTDYFTTSQDYMRSEQVKITLFNKVFKDRRHQVTLRVPIPIRDRRKSKVATCVNFIHQRDAFIAMNVVNKFSDKPYSQIYTVHDNFITTSIFAKAIPNIYIEVFREMGNPLKIINNFILHNILGRGTKISKTIKFDYSSFIHKIMESDLDWVESLTEEERANMEDAYIFKGLKDNPSSYAEEWRDEPIIESYLKWIFQSRIPENLKPKEREKMDKMVEDILHCYNQYTSNVYCKTSTAIEINYSVNEKWTDFCNSLQEWERRSNNYCLHY